jgi:hypothetical protein
MTGKILGFDSSSNEGTISADNGTRYKFTKEYWKDASQPEANMIVDFEASDDNMAKDIYLTVKTNNENTTMGLVAVGLTLLFGFIGTFISRAFLAKQSFGSSILPSVLHLFAGIILIIPLLGWLIYFGITGYFMYKNYKLIVEPKY